MRNKARAIAAALLVAGGLLVGGLPASAAEPDTGTDGTRVTGHHHSGGTDGTRVTGTDGTRVTGTDNKDW